MYCFINASIYIPPTMTLEEQNNEVSLFNIHEVLKFEDGDFLLRF